MVKSNKGRSVHDVTQGHDGSPRVDNQGVADVGLGSGGFDYNPKEVTGTRAPKNDSNYEHGPDYQEQDDVRDWETQGQFSPKEEVFNVFSEVMSAPEKKLEEDQELVTDGGFSYGDQEVYADGSHATMTEVDHVGPYADDEGGAPW